MTIYERIKLLREQQGMSQQDLADRVGFKTASAINKIEMGLRDINQSKIIAFAKALSVSPSYLLDGDMTKNEYTNLSLVEIIEKAYGKATADALHLYTQLDADDQGEIRGEMKQMLKAEKYLEKDGHLNNQAI